MLYKKSNKILIAILAAFLLNVTVYANDKVSFIVDDKEYFDNKEPISLKVNDQLQTNLPMNPVVYNDFLLVPAREVLEPLGAIVEYSNESKICTLYYNEHKIHFAVNDTRAVVNSNVVEMAVPPKIINDKLMLPLRFISQAFGLKIDWDPIQRIASVNNLVTELPMQTAVIKEDIQQEAIPEGTYEEPAQTNEDIIKEEEKEITVTDSSTTTLQYIDNERSKVVNVYDNSSSFTIELSSALSYVEKSLISGDKLVIDILNADLEMANHNLNVNTANVKSVRLGQEEGTKITRVVFDLQKGTTFKISYSDDRKKIFVNFEENDLQGLEFMTDGTNDNITIKNSSEIAPTVTFSPNPDRLILDYANTKVLSVLDESKEGKFVTNIKTQQNDNTGRVIIYLNSQANFTVSGAKVTISAPTLKNISYDFQNKRLTIKKTSNVNYNLLHNDDYTNLNYILDLGGTADIGYGKYYIQDNYIKYIDIVNDGTTKLKINENQILALQIEEDGDNYYINFKAPKELYPLVVVLDPGHGGNDSGASKNGAVEKRINTDVVERVATLIKADDIIKAYLTKEGDTFVQLEERPRIANRIGDIFVSVHSNSSTSGTAQGTEVHYYTHSNDGELGFASSQFSEIMQKHLIMNLGSVDRGTKRSNFAVLRITDIPAILIEVGFVSNSYEAELLNNPDYRQKIAQGIYNALLETATVYKPR